MFLYSDIQILKTKTLQREIDEDVTAIWTNYLSKDKVPFISEDSFKMVSESFSKGAPFSVDIFDSISKDLFHAALEGPLRNGLANFAVATLYKKRVSKLDSDLPDELFPKLMEELDQKHWKEISNKKGFSGSRNRDKNYKGINFKTDCDVTRSASDTLDIIWDINRRYEWEASILETKVLEKLGPRTDATWMLTKIWGLADFCYLQTKKVLEDGTIAMLCTSIDHPLAPENKFPRHQLAVYAISIKPLDENNCHLTIFYQSIYGSKVVAFLNNFDWFALMALSGGKTLKKVLEGKKKLVRKTLSKKQEPKTKVTADSDGKST